MKHHLLALSIVFFASNSSAMVSEEFTINDISNGMPDKEFESLIDFWKEYELDKPRMQLSLEVYLAINQCARALHRSQVVHQLTTFMKILCNDLSHHSHNTELCVHLLKKEQKKIDQLHILKEAPVHSFVHHDDIFFAYKDQFDGGYYLFRNKLSLEKATTIIHTKNPKIFMSNVLGMCTFIFENRSPIYLFTAWGIDSYFENPLCAISGKTLRTITTQKPAAIHDQAKDEKKPRRRKK